jgi:hypothetical protein
MSSVVVRNVPRVEQNGEQNVKPVENVPEIAFDSIIDLENRKGLVCLQFIVQDERMVPPTILRLMKRDAVPLSDDEKEGGELVIPPTKYVSVEQLLEALTQDERRDFVAADYVPRPSNGGFKWRLIFATKDQSFNHIANFEVVKEDVLNEATSIIKSKGAMVRVDINPLFFRGKKVIGKDFVLVGVAMKRWFKPRLRLMVYDDAITLATLP